MPRYSYAFATGDRKPIVLQDVTSSTGASVTSATGILYDRNTKAAIGSAMPLTVSGPPAKATLSSPIIPWDAEGAFVFLAAVTFADGVVDNSLSVGISVATPAP